MFKKFSKILFFLVILSLLGLCISRGASYLINSISFDTHIESFHSDKKSDVKNDLILLSTNNTEKDTVIQGTRVLYGIPMHIRIESVGIALEIKEGGYNYEKQTWTLTNGFAYWANLSDPIYSSGSNTVIYAHNQKNEFLKTKNLKIGDKIYITTDQGGELTFEYIADYIVDPTRGEIIFEEVETSQIILITCNGRFSENRRIIVAKLI